MATLKTIQVEPGYYVGSTTLADIRGNCPDPKRVDLSTETQRIADPDLRRAHEQRGGNQRQFKKARIDRAVAYAQYINELRSGRLGGYPPITLWTEDTPVFTDGELHIAGSSILTANDGETQLAARYMMAAEDPRWLDVPFAVTITTGSTKAAAAQTLHDMNNYATPVSEKETAGLNVEGPLTKAINAGVELAGFNASLIKARTEKVTGSYLTTNTILLHGAIGALYEDALVRSPNSMIKAANKQFGVLDDASIVTDFIGKVLALPNEVLSSLTSDQMLALGAKYRSTTTVLTPLTADQYAEMDTDLRATTGGKRATVTKRAIAIYGRLAA